MPCASVWQNVTCQRNAGRARQAAVRARPGHGARWAFRNQSWEFWNVPGRPPVPGGASDPTSSRVFEGGGAGSAWGNSRPFDESLCRILLGRGRHIPIAQRPAALRGEVFGAPLYLFP